MSSKPTVCVIGAGAAGLVSAKVLLEDGFSVVVYERNAGLGGIWEPTCTYPTLGIQSPAHLYSFSDLPYKGDETPAAEINEYFTAYSDKFHVTPLIRFKIEVVSCKQVQNNKWEVTIKDLSSDVESSAVFDFLCVCTGAFGVPMIPRFADQEKFTGEIIHTRNFHSEDKVTGKRVAVIGMGKSALDCATLAGQKSSKAYLIFQKPYYMVFRRIAGGKMDRIVMFGRLFECMLPPHYKVSHWTHRLFHKIAPNFIKKYWTNVRKGLQACYNLPSDHPLFPTGIDVTKPLYWIAGLVPLHFLDLVRAEKIQCIKATIKRFMGGSTVELSTGEQIDLDTVLLCTGYHLDFPFFEEYLKKKMGLPYRLGADANTDFELYHQVFPLEVPNIAFNGYRVTVVALKSFEVTAHYISDYFQNKLVKLPKTLKERKEEFDRELKFLRNITDKGLYNWAPYNQICCDVLLEEMGIPKVRTNWFFTEYIRPLTAYCFDNLGQQRRDRDAGKSLWHPYFGFLHLLFIFWTLVIGLIYYRFF